MHVAADVPSQGLNLNISVAYPVCRNSWCFYAIFIFRAFQLKILSLPHWKEETLDCLITIKKLLLYRQKVKLDILLGDRFFAYFSILNKTLALKFAVSMINLIAFE